MSKLLAAFITMALSNLAFGSNWVLVEMSADKDFHSIDQESIASSGKYKKAWFRTDYGSMQTLKYQPKNYLSSKSLWYFNCQERTMAATQQLFYSGQAGNGELVDSYTYPIQSMQFSEVAPDTIGESMLNAVCRGIKRSSKS
jgi:hypothetical protein